MRATGRTTRMIDNAIQCLFEQGNIIVPSKHIKDENLRSIKYRIFIDLDSRVGNKAQEHFLKKLLNRLNQEHAGFYNFDNHNGIFHISVKSK